MSKSLYTKNGEYAFLPKDLRDFHNQKELFKKLTNNYPDWVKNVPKYMSENLINLSWVDMQILTFDYLLFQLAQYGYVLSKSDKFKVVESAE